MPSVFNKAIDQIPAGAVYVGRPSKWGNPFRIGQVYQGRYLDRRGAVDAHRDWLLHSDEGAKLLADIEELRGKDVVCWCDPLPCHGDTLVELANKPKDE